ncbi:MAG: hypothetical protein ACLU9S_18530 [Oscillospiraceae bacterium]
MDLKTCRWMTRAALCGLSGAGNHRPPLDNQILRMGLLALPLALALMVAMVRDKLWRCPKCGKMLPKGGKVRCQSCGWEML